MNILIKFSYLLQIISSEEGKKKSEGIILKIFFQLNGHRHQSYRARQSLRSLLLAESPGVEEHPEDNDLTEENDGHEIATTVQAHGYCALELEYSFGLLS